MLGLVAVTLVLVAGIALLARSQSARGAAQAAADLGALAAAGQLTTASQGGAARACQLARDVVTANGATLTGCVVLGGGVVRIATAAAAGLRTATASARAGPAPARWVDPGQLIGQ